MNLLFTSIIIVELVALQYLIIVLLFLLACPPCPKRGTRSSKKRNKALSFNDHHWQEGEDRASKKFYE